MMETDLNADFGRVAVARTAAMEWQASPSPSVWRKRLELSGPAEAGRATSVVRYDPDSAFPAHEHPDGEEILVLEGVLSDETGDYPAGCYLLNPEGFSHAPTSREGCVLFVKLRQYPGKGRRRVVLDTNKADWQPTGAAGIDVLPLYAEAGHPETMHLVRIAPDAPPVAHDHPGGEEIFVIEGSLEDEGGRYETGAWVRYPPGSRHAPAAPEGCLLYVKSGHLAG